MTFRVKANYDAFVTLSEDNGKDPGRANAVEIGLSVGNRLCTIGEVGQDPITRPTGAVINSRIFVEFWIRWTFNEVEFGFGDEFNQFKIMNYTMKKKTELDLLSFRTENNVGDWLIPYTQCNITYIFL